MADMNLLNAQLVVYARQSQAVVVRYNMNVDVDCFLNAGYVFLVQYLTGMSCGDFILTTHGRSGQFNRPGRYFLALPCRSCIR